MQGIYTHIPETNYVPREHGVAAILLFLFMYYYYYYYYYYLLKLGCNPVAVVILHVYKTRNWLLLNLSREGYIRSM